MCLADADALDCRLYKHRYLRQWCGAVRATDAATANADPQ